MFKIFLQYMLLYIGFGLKKPIRNELLALNEFVLISSNWVAASHNKHHRIERHWPSIGL